MTRPVVVLLSGGLDSATVLALARNEGHAVHALSFAYGQRHAVELDAARALARDGGVVAHRIVDIDLAAFGGSALTGDFEVPKGRDPEAMARAIPVTYVPARNTIFLSLALGYAEVIEADTIFIGANARDYSGYPDCRPAFIEAFESLANLALRRTVEGGDRMKIRAPLIDLGKDEIIRLGLDLGVDYGRTRSCYDPDSRGHACGLCDACLLRLKGFQALGLTDPAPYRNRNAGGVRDMHDHGPNGDGLA